MVTIRRGLEFTLIWASLILAAMLLISGEPHHAMGWIAMAGVVDLYQRRRDDE